MPATANATRSRDALDAAAFTHRGFHCYPRHAPDTQGQGVAVVWQVKTVTREAAAGYHAATGEWLSMVDFGPVTAADLRAQIDDVMMGFAAEKIVHADGSASIVSPSTGQLYAQLTPAQQADEAASEQRALSEQQERQAAKAARELAREERQATMAAERQAAQDAAAAALAARQREDDKTSEAWRVLKEKTDQELAAARRRHLREQHKEEDAAGLQRTNLDGKLLCDSCQRVYHDPGFEFCYGCTRGKKQHEHRRRVESGEIAARVAARQSIRDVYMAPARAAAQQDAAVAEAARQNVNGEINAALELAGLPIWSGEGFQKYCYSVRDRDPIQGGWVREADRAAVTHLLENVDTLSPGAYRKISDYLDILRRAMARASN